MTAFALAQELPWARRAAVLALCRMAEPANDEFAASHPVRDDPLAALLKAAAGGNARAFDAFYTAAVRPALALARRIVGEALAEDVVADCFFQAWRDAARFDPARGSALGWLLTMARSRALDRLRQETLRHGGLAGAPEFDADTAPCGDGQPPDLLETVQSSTRLHAALRELSANERWVLTLAYFRDHTQAEIAEMTGMPLGTVKSLMLRGQHKLRECLQPSTAVKP